MSLIMGHTEPTQEQIGNYRLEQLIGVGGFAQVFLGRHIYNGTMAAIKVLDEELASQEELRDFRAEAYLLASLRHRHIVRVLEFGLYAEPPFLAMDYASHGTLRELFHPGVCLPLHALLPYVLQIAGALDYIHAAGFVHCDVKPENILLASPYEAWLGDFGIAANVHALHLQASPISRGTARYAAPEQIQGKPQPASDQYALAVMVCEWLCGDSLYQGSAFEICMQHLHAPVPALRDRIPSLSPAVERVLRQALAKDPARRFARASDFAQALRTAAHRESRTRLAPFTRPFLQHMEQNASFHEAQTLPLDG